MLRFKKITNERAVNTVEKLFFAARRVRFIRERVFETLQNYSFSQLISILIPKVVILE